MELIQKLQDIDVVHESEKLGNEYLALILQHEKTKHLNELYDSTADTKFSEKIESYKAKVEALGFKVIYQKEFDNDGETETHYVMFNEEYCLLLNWDTHTGRRNSATMYFNLMCTNFDAIPNRSSGGWESYLDPGTFQTAETPFAKPTWSSYYVTWEEYSNECDDYSVKLKTYANEHNLIHIFNGRVDAREGIKSCINTATKKGTFIDWKFSQNLLWLLNYGDTKKPSYDCEKLSEIVWRTFPIEIQKRLKLI
jgi:hypothetical protein